MKDNKRCEVFFDNVECGVDGKHIPAVAIISDGTGTTFSVCKFHMDYIEKQRFINPRSRWRVVAELSCK